MKTTKALTIAFTSVFLLYLTACHEQSTLPEVSTNQINNITRTTAQVLVSISSNGNESIFEKGICFSLNNIPTVNDSVVVCGFGSNDYTADITGLSENSNYYVRSYAKNRIGLAYGAVLHFSTKNAIETVNDFNGNTYHAVQIGSQIWLEENLKTSNFLNGDIIPLLVEQQEWVESQGPAHSFYCNDSVFFRTYGNVYNHDAVTDSRGICPAGYHVPDSSEWMTLINNQGGVSQAGVSLKEIGYKHWFRPNTGASNSSGFTALPSGWRQNSNEGENFQWRQKVAAWWIGSSVENDSAYCVHLTNGNEINLFNMHKKTGIAVRCIKN